jgi:hypothetical protein
MDSRRASIFGLGRFALAPAWKHHLRRLDDDLDVAE